MDEKHTSVRETEAPALSAAEVERRKGWLKFEPDTLAAIKDIDNLMSGQAGKMMDDMYDHFLSFAETRSFFPSEEILQRAKEAQKRYFERLTKGNYDLDYVNERLQVGSTHHRINLDPKWYLGAYSYALDWFRNFLTVHTKNNQAELSRLMSALSKVMFFDVELALESYINAKEAAIRAQRDAIRELEMEKRLTKSMLGEAPVGIVSMDVDFIVRDCNQEFLEIIETRNLEAVINRSLLEVCPHLRGEDFQNVCQTGMPMRKTADLLNLSASPNEALAYWDWAMWPVKENDGHTSGLFATFSSATERVLLQQQREDFVATLTHDLKTPILAANRAIKLLLEGDFGEIAEDQSRILETIHQSNEAMYRLVQTLLDVYRYDSGAKKLTIDTHNLRETIDRLLEEVNPLAHAKGISLSAFLPENLEHVSCDVEEIRRVIQNLLDNALKFTPSGGAIEIKVDQEEAGTHISVRDTGKGISEEDKPKLFQRFWQAAGSGRYYASTGLGLYLCRKIVEGHGGRIWCESKQGAGSTFHFTLNYLPD